MTTPAPRWRMPAEWEPHDATWIAWPHHAPDWPDKLEAIHWVYAEIVRVLAEHERVDILCHTEALRAQATYYLQAHAVKMHHVHLHLTPTDRVWLRDSAPTFIWTQTGAVELMAWDFNAWAKYDNYHHDHEVPAAIHTLTTYPITRPTRPDAHPLVLEGGGIDVNGTGRIMVTEEWLLSDTQVRNPGLTRQDYEQAFAHYLGCPSTIWLGAGCAGDDTHGHIDDIARFVTADTVVLAYEA
ncbi:MAG TPA: agmatine deiminase family protein, partial [Gemmatimonadaceae bacterium]|nr:agmatine deiminase family protein [Gemmatimonadaceae bacterium]